MKRYLIGEEETVDNLLKKGVWFSIFWLFGFGSLIAIRNALKAWRLINRSGGTMKYDGRITWCLIVGGAGVGFWIFGIIMMFINNK